MSRILNAAIAGVLLSVGVLLSTAEAQSGIVGEPFILEPPANVSINTGGNVTLTCVVVDPNGLGVSFNWTGSDSSSLLLLLPNATVVTEDDSNGTFTSSLSLPPLDSQHDGSSFTCTATVVMFQLLTSDPATITVNYILTGFNATSITAGEGAGLVSVCVFADAFNAAVNSSLSGTLSTQDNTATAGLDYQAVSERLTFPAASYPTTLCVGIPLLPDTLREDQETVALSWRLEGAGSLGEVTTPTASITIVDVRVEILTGPGDQVSLDPGSTAVFQVTAQTSSGQLLYQWQRGGQNLRDRKSVV